MHKTISRGAIILSALLIWIWFSPTPVFSQAPFYQGKTITIVQGRGPGGTGDIRVRALVPFLQKYIPGNPTIVMEFMPGGGSRKAANHIYSVARPDGFSIGNVSAGLILLAILGEPGVTFDIDKFIYLGSPYSAYHAVFLTRKEAGLNSLEKLRAAIGIRIGAQSVGFSTYNEGRLFAYLLGLKEPRFVTGYAGAEIDQALTRGEVDARSTGADSVLRRNRAWLEQGLVDFHTILETPKGVKHPRFAHLPEIETFAKSDRERKLVAMQRAARVAGSPFILPPGTPKDRAEILREAFRRTFKDPEFRKEYERITRDEPTPLFPEDHDRVIREIPREPEIIALFKKLVGPDPLPPR